MATGDVKRRVAAILSADVAGYSRLMEEDEVYTVQAIESCRTIHIEITCSGKRKRKDCISRPA